MAAPENLRRRELSFAGQVQGVGFRATAASLARQHNLTGFVRNLPDGRVEAVVEGIEGDIGAFLARLRGVFDRHIRDSRAADKAATGEFASFDIRY